MSFFSEQELRYIREHADWPSEEIAIRLSKKTSEVKQARKTLGITEFPPKKDWSPEEDRLLRENYGKLTYKEIMLILHRTKASITKRAKTLGLSVGKGKHRIMCGREWTCKEIEYLFEHKKDSIENIAKTLDRSISSVRSKQTNLGLRKKTRKKWTKREINYLYTHGYTESYETISQNLNRSLIAIKNKARSLGINKFATNVTVGQIERAFGIDTTYITKYWIKQYGMPAQKLQIGATVAYDIDIEAFWKWASNHLNIVPIHKYVIGSLLPEPSNLNELIEIAPKRAINHRKAYSVVEKKQIKEEYAAGKAIGTIADQHGRSVCSIRHVLKGD